MFTTFQLMNSNMTYEEATALQLKICAIALILIIVLYSIERITKKYCPKIYQKLKQYNIF